jgi:hypothetical protein
VLHDGPHRLGEGLPAHVRLGPGQQQVRRAAVVVHQPDDEPRRLVVAVVVLDERHRWPAGPVVVELVDLEAGDHAARRRLEQVGDGERGRAAGVEEPVESGQHHRALGETLELGNLVDDVHETCLGHGCSCRSIALPA